MKVEQTDDAERPFSWEVTSLEFSGGQEIPLEPGSLLVLIGPNSSGKSTALREIENDIIGVNQDKVVLSEVTVSKNWNPGGFVAWLEERFPSRVVQGERFFFTRKGNLSDSQARSFSRSGPFLVHRLDTESRLEITRTKNALNRSTNQAPEEYIHVLQENEELLSDLSALVRTAFGMDLIIYQGGGPQVWFHVGDEPERTVDRDRVSSEYLQGLDAVPKLDIEGDGIRSFVGTLLAARCGNQPLLLIDEPEAFLHPPQARRLATAIAASVGEQNRQAIIATHSADVLRELASRSDHVSICRITRDGNRNNAALLEAHQVKKLWASPLLRSSAGLEGLFHEGVVVCEGDADARFYEALVALLEEGHKIERADLHFVHGGGKGQLAALASAYTSLNTNTAVIADIDILREKPLVERVIAALGGDFAGLEGVFNTTVAALEERPPVTSARSFVEQIGAILEAVSRSGRVEVAQRRSIGDLLAAAGDWSEAKKYGLNKLQGGTYDAGTELFARLEGIGLFVVPVGELEGWWRAGPADKGSWAVSALEKVSSEPDLFKPAADFLIRLCRFLGVEDVTQDGQDTES